MGQFNIDYTDKIYKIDLPFSVKKIIQWYNLIHDFFKKNIVIKGIACGINHCLLWDNEGQIFSWGDGSDGKLGHSSMKGGYNYMIVHPTKVIMNSKATRHLLYMYFR